MYGTEITNGEVPMIVEKVGKLQFRIPAAASKLNNKLKSENKRLFTRLLQLSECDNKDESISRFKIETDTETARHLRNIRDISEKLVTRLRDEVLYLKSEELLSWVNKKYHAKVSGINLDKLLTMSDDIKSRVTALHREITNLSEVQNEVAAEHESFKKKSACYNAEIFRTFKSGILDSIWKRVRLLYKQNYATGTKSEKVIRLIREINELHDRTSVLAQNTDIICWFEIDENNENKLCAIPKNLSNWLYDDIWSGGVPTILTSGTLSANKDFTRTKSTLGLDKLGDKITETSKSSPFNYHENAMLYISENVTFPNQKSWAYITELTDEIERLIRAANGHTAILFTSYRVMGLVFGNLSKRKLPFPMFKLEKSTSNAIEKFKQSGGGVLFASEAMWGG
ncbi:hypothetical protein FACS189499_06180 [Clostridia bacterium]|nr:hypothetical protein FACS189499_06180 [Clostridia bacterium]